MKNIFLALFIGVVSLGLSAQEKKIAQIEFEAVEVDYGKVEKNSDGVREFKFKNTGDAPLVITNVSSSCGCTIPEKPNGPIPPGGEEVIKVKYDTNRVGPIRKTITVNSNAKNSMVSLKIKGEVLNDSK